MKATLRYFSGTGNSYRVAVRCAERLRTNADAIEMPANWTAAMNPPDKQEAARISEKGLAKACERKRRSRLRSFRPAT